MHANMLQDTNTEIVMIALVVAVNIDNNPKVYQE
jgi:hypothetical protein